MKGYEEGYDRHLLNVAEMVLFSWERIFEMVIARCLV